MLRRVMLAMRVLIEMVANRKLKSRRWGLAQNAVLAILSKG